MAKSPNTKRRKLPKTVLKLSDLEQSKSAVLNGLASASSQQSYDHAIREFIEWYCSEPRLAFNKTVVPSAIASRDDLATLRAIEISSMGRNRNTQLAHSYAIRLRIFGFIGQKMADRPSVRPERPHHEIAVHWFTMPGRPLRSRSWLLRHRCGSEFGSATRTGNGTSWPVAKLQNPP